MHFLVEVGANVLSAVQSVQRRTESLRSNLSMLGAPETLIPSDTDLGELARNERAVLLLTEGCADFRLGGFPLASIEVGDVISPHSVSRGCSLRCNFAIRAQKISWGSCEDLLRNDHEFFQNWFGLMHAERELFTALTAEFMARTLGASEGTSPMPVTVMDGEVLIKQGDVSDDVYTLIEGKLEVFVDSVKVGQIEKDEIFGVISALADAPRSASVVSTAQSLVLKLPKGEFLQLMRARPTTVLELVRGMARALVSANVKVVSLTKRLTT